MFPPINVPGFTVLPDRKWVLETGRVYTVLVDAYDKHSHKLYPSDVGGLNNMN